MIPLSLPNLIGNERKYVKECLETGWVSTAGAFVQDFESSFAKKVGMKDAASIVNGTSALHMAMMQFVKRGEIVILPNLSFVATANAAMYVGAEPYFIDINEEDWQMDLNLLEEFLHEECEVFEEGTRLKKKQTKIAAIAIVHNQGNMCDMERLLAISKKFKIKLIEDAAESLGSKFKSKDSGTFGEIGCFSFNGNKIITTGGGGMIVSNNESILKKIKHLSTTAKVDPLRYLHDEVGYNYRMVNILAAIGLAQLEQLDYFVQRKKEIASFYRNSLENLADIKFQRINNDVESNEWLFTIRTSKAEELMNFLNNSKIMSRPFWMPMSMLPMYKDNYYFSKKDQSRAVHETCLTLPCSTGITAEELDLVVQKIKEFY